MKKRPGQRESVLHAFMQRQFRRGQCATCNKPMKTCDEPGLYADNVCTGCRPDLLKFLMEHGGAPMQKATVKWFNNTKGFGFLTLEDGREAFVHYSVFEGDTTTLSEADEVEVEVADGPRGPYAARVRRIR